MASAWASLVEQNVALVQAVIAATAKAPRHTSWLTYVRCHDDIVWSTLKPQVQDLGGDYLSRVGHVSRFLAGQVEGSYAHGLSFQTAGNSEAVHGTNGMCAALTGYSAAARYAQERILILYALACAHGGVPVIYMGDELGQGNDADGWHRQDSRWVHRPYWDESLFEASPSLLQEMKALFQKRAAHPDFAAGQPLQLLDSACPAVLLFKRGQNTLCAFNFSDAEQELKSLDLRLAPWTYRFIAMK
jgi:amylosucrase